MPTILGAGTVDIVAVGNTSTEILAEDTTRNYARITNMSDEIMYLNFDGAAVATKGIALAPVDTNGNPVQAGIWETGKDGLLFRGAVNGITASGSKNAATFDVVAP